MIRCRRVRWVGCGGEEICMRGLVGILEKKKRDHNEDLGVDGRIAYMN